MVPFPDGEPVKVGPRHALPLVEFTRHGEQGPDPPLPTAHVNITIPTMLMASPRGRGDPPASIMNYPILLASPRLDKEHSTKYATFL